MHTLLQDLRISIRSLGRSLGFSVTAVLTVGLGIGAVTSVFSAVNSILLTPFDFQDPEHLVMLREAIREQNYAPGPDSYKDYINWKSNSRSLAEAAIFKNQAYSVSADADHPDVVGGLSVSPSFFAVLGSQPVLGRSLLPTEASAGRNNVVILSWSAWHRYFHGDSGAVGRTLRIDGTPKTVVGVLPQGFIFPHMNEMGESVSQTLVRPYEIFAPLLPDTGDSVNYNFLVIARLKPGVSAVQAASELSGLQAAYARAVHLPLNAMVLVKPLSKEALGGVTTALWLLLGAVGAVLLIGCVNLANLQLVRAVAREREVAVRLALGASRGRLFFSALNDSLVLASIGGAFGVLLSFLGTRLFVAVAPSALPRLSQTHVSWSVLAVAAGLSISTAMLFGTTPALRLVGVDPRTAMQTSANRVVNTYEGQRTRHLLVGAQVACTVVLLIVAGLLLSSFSKLLMQHRDFESEHLTLVQTRLAGPQYGSAPNESIGVRAGFIDRALTGLGGVAGVESVAMTSEMPLAGETWVSDVLRPDHPLPPGHEPSANMRWVSPSYVSTLKISLLEGRDLGESDRDHPTNVLVSGQMARAVWPGEDPLGRTFKAGGKTTYTVVGVVADARINDLRTTANMIYIPYWQNPWWRMYFLVRSPLPTSRLADSIRQIIWNIDPQVAIPTLKSMDDQVDDSVATERFQTVLLSSFGAAALLLALLGVYGVLAYSVSLRQQEFGIRIALGSDKVCLMWLVLRQAAIPTVAGAVVGLLSSFLVTRWVGSLLYDTKPTDPGVISCSIGVLFLVALLAALFPARRAASVDPMKVLRGE
jgi:predicted permease